MRSERRCGHGCGECAVGDRWRVGQWVWVSRFDIDLSFDAICFESASPLELDLVNEAVTLALTRYALALPTYAPLAVIHAVIAIRSLRLTNARRSNQTVNAISMRHL